MIISFYPILSIFTFGSILTYVTYLSYIYNRVRVHYGGIFVLVFGFFLYLSWAVYSYKTGGLLVSSGFWDGVSLSLVWLTVLLVGLCVVYSYNVVGFSYIKSNWLLLAMFGLLALCFSAPNLFQFYIYFEGVLIPMIMVVALGSRGRKVHAVFLFFFYTFASSLFLLIGVILVYSLTGTMQFTGFYASPLLGFYDQLLVFSLFFLGFAAKIPIVPLHIWLPEAHVEAPTIGSVLLAGILLKLGAYGMYRVILPLCSGSLLSYIKPAVLTLLLISATYSALAAVRQVDIKKIVAYSSVVHMSFALLGLVLKNGLGLRGFLFLLLSHGFISAAMFFAVGMIYDRFHTRNVLYLGGLVQYMPVFSLLFFCVMFSNLSLPGTCNFVGELFVLYGLFAESGLLTVLVGLVALALTVVFCLVLLYRVIFYQLSGVLTSNLVDLTYYEFLILVVLLSYIVGFGVFPNALLFIFF